MWQWFASPGPHQETINALSVDRSFDFIQVSRQEKQGENGTGSNFYKNRKFKQKFLPHTWQHGVSFFRVYQM